MQPDNNGEHYALVKLEESARTVKQAIHELPIMRTRLDKYQDNKPKAREVYGDLQHLVNKLHAALSSAALPLLEMELMDIADFSVKLSRSVKAFNLLTPDYSKLCAALSGYLDKLPISDSLNFTTNAHIIGRLMASVKMGYYPTEIEHAKHIARGIGFPDGKTVNLFDPCCGCGLALRMLAGEHDCRTYGVELDGHRAEESLTRLDRVGFGSYFRSRISNEAFHAMLLNPPYLSVMNAAGTSTRHEKRFLVDSLSHLMYGGLLIYIIPFYRLTVDICRVLCDNFDDLTVWKFTGDEYKKFRQVAIMGTRCRRRDGSAMVADLAAQALEADRLVELPELPENRYILPAVEAKVALFKGAEFNVAELAEQLSKSTSFSRLFEKNKLDSEMKRPLLPLNLGQVGLIGGSGMINGLVECDTPHIIKGRIVKENNVSREKNLNTKGELISTTVSEIRSNKMIFNLLTPDGFRSLSDYSGMGANADAAKSDGAVSVIQAVPAKPRSPYNARFPMGKVGVTAHAQDVLTDADIHAALARHGACDWGEASKSDGKANDDALKYGERIISAYTSAGNKKFWIITEADRSATTVMMPDDY